MYQNQYREFNFYSYLISSFFTGLKTLNLSVNSYSQVVSIEDFRYIWVEVEVEVIELSELLSNDILKY